MKPFSINAKRKELTGHRCQHGWSRVWVGLGLGLGRAAYACLLVVLCLGGPLPAGAADKPEKKSAEKKSATENPEKKKPKVDRLEVPIPVNHSAEGIKVPDEDRDGNLQMIFEIGSALRVNEDQLEMSNLKIETYNDQKEVETRIAMASATLNLITREIISEKPVTISREGFEITGSHLTFQAKTRSGTFRAPVRMLIYDRDNFDEPKTKQEEGHRDAKVDASDDANKSASKDAKP